jgi:thiol oxidase
MDLSKFRSQIYISIWLFLLLRISTLVSADEKSLYAPGDNVLELDVNNFHSSVYNQPRAFFVEFYSSWCGHCINYKPKWVEFATSLKDWSNVVQVSVVNCADEKNSPLCREHEIDAFPTLKYFGPESQTKDNGHKYDGDKYSLDSMTLDVVKLVRADFQKLRPTNWPKIEGTPSTINLEQLWSSMESTKQILAVIIEEDPFLNGFATIIQYHRNPFINSIVIPSSHPIAQQFGGVSLPALLVFKRDNPQSLEYSSKEAVTFTDIKKKLDEYTSNLADSNHQGPPPPPHPAAANSPLEPSPHPANGKSLADNIPIDFNQYKVQYLDIASALNYMLNQEIPRKPIIDGEKLSALKGWIHLLKKYVPGTVPIRRLFYRLDEWTQLQSSIKAEDWIEKVESLQKDLGHPLPTNSTWIACKGSQAYLRGYTCGLWTLMHALTVQAYNDEKHNSAFKPVVEVLEPLHQFIFNYLSCEICAKNFHHMTESNQLSLVTRPEDTVLWLWRAHNNVNKRLSGDASEDPKYPKRQFPPAALCPDCYINGIPMEEKILEFMVRYYSDVRTDEVVPQPGYKMTEFENGKIQKVANKHLNPKFAIHADKIDKLEEAEARLREIDGGPKRHWKNLDADSYAAAAAHTQTADRSTFYLVWIVIIVAALAFAYMKYRQNRSKFWKTLYYYNDYKV